jgi:hypothetical protein
MRRGAPNIVQKVRSSLEAKGEAGAGGEELAGARVMPTLVREVRSSLGQEVMSTPMREVRSSGRGVHL